LVVVWPLEKQRLASWFRRAKRLRRNQTQRKSLVTPEQV
jgi:hypothetical protein